MVTALPVCGSRGYSCWHANVALYGLTTCLPAGLVGAERARRGEGNRPPAGYVAPEAAGLPVDDSYNYLALMKRWAGWDTLWLMFNSADLRQTQLHECGLGALRTT
jgi:hypothetical protein